MGDSSLRRALSKKLATLNVHAGPENIITTVGATHALDIISRSLLRPGDPVMVEEPGWAVEFARLTALGMRLLPVPRRLEGPDLAVMERYCEVYKPKLYVSVSVLHNPTGYSPTPGSAHRVLQLANKHDFVASSRTTLTATSRPSTRRGCVRSMGCSAPSTSAALPRSWRPTGGWASWLGRYGVDTEALTQRMLDQDYLLAPGALFHAQRKPSTLMRINSATTQEAAFWRCYAAMVRKM
ncbi:MAG: hypothetical protein NVS2B4_00250 [Ramlibacter sp.]